MLEDCPEQSPRLLVGGSGANYKKRKEERGKEREGKRKRREKEREEKEEKRTELALSSSALQIDLIPRTPRSNKLCKTTAANIHNQ
jgi:hypothetical protein